MQTAKFQSLSQSPVHNSFECASLSKRNTRQLTGTNVPQANTSASRVSSGLLLMKFQSLFTRSIYLFSRTTKGSSFETVPHLRMNVKSDIWDCSTFPSQVFSPPFLPTPSSCFCFSPFVLKVRPSLGRFYISNHTKKFTLVFGSISWCSLWWDWHSLRIYGQVVGANFET